MTTYVTIPCHRPYVDLLKTCIKSLQDDGVDLRHILVVSNGEDPIWEKDFGAHDTPVILGYRGDWNMSKWWNFGMDWAASDAAGRDHEVLVLNADATVEPGCIEKLSSALRTFDLAIAAPDYYKTNGKRAVRINNELIPLMKSESMPGCAFMVRGEIDLRCDTRIPGYFNDDDIEWQGRTRGGVGMVRDAVVNHVDHGCGQEYSEEGLLVFWSKWGNDPWI